MRTLALGAACLLLAGTYGCSGPRAENTTTAPDRSAGEQTQPAQAVEIDPVCGMEVDAAKAAGKSEHKGKTYFFCSDHCKRTFDSDPQAALSRQHGKM